MPRGNKANLSLVQEESDLRSLYGSATQVLFTYFLPVNGYKEFAVLMFVNERTLRFNKLIEHISQRHFLKGVKTKKESIHLGLPISASTLWRTVGSLQRDGLLFRDNAPPDKQYRGNIYSLNLLGLFAPVFEGKVQGYEITELQLVAVLKRASE